MEKSRGNLLLEFFSEEIPARMQLNSEIQLQNLFVKSLTQRDIAFESFKTFSGPRHLSIIIKSIELEQKDQEIEKRGPRFDANQKAIDGFLKSNQLKIDETIIKETNNGKFYFHSQMIKGQKTYEILPDIISEIVNGFVWPKSQRWANTDLKWARPLRNIVLLLNDDVVKGKVEIGKQDRRIAIAEIIPKLDIIAQYGFNDEFEDALGALINYRFETRLRWRLFDGGRAFAGVKAAERRIDQANIQFADLRSQIRFEVEEAYYNLIANKGNIESTRKNITTREEGLRLARLRFQAGIGVQSDVIDAQRDLSKARGDFLQAIIEYNRSINLLQRAVSNFPDSLLFKRI